MGVKKKKVTVAPARHRRWENLQSTRRYKQSHRPTCAIFFMATLRFSWIFHNKQYEWEQYMGSFNAYLQEYLSVVCVIVHHILKPFSSPVINCHLYLEVFSIHITLDTRIPPSHTSLHLTHVSERISVTIFKQSCMIRAIK